MDESVLMQRKFNEEWALTFCGTALVSVLMTAFLLGEPEWEVSALDQVIDGDAEHWPLAGEAIVLETSIATPVYALGPYEPQRPVVARLAVPVEDARAFAAAGFGPVDHAAELAELDLNASVAAEGPSNLLAAATRVTDPAKLVLQAELENQLKLSKSQRAVIQRRLVLAGYNPKGVDGIFGEETRGAIATLQEAEGLPSTGYLDAATLLNLTDATEEKYAAWRSEQAEKRRARAQFAKVEVPPQRPHAPAEPRKAERCARDAEGRIIGHQGFVCDLSGLGESLISFDLPDADRDGPRLAEVSSGAER